MLDKLQRGINNRFGSKRGLLNHVRALAEWSVGRYVHLKRVDFTRVTRLVFVCSGNICRSALACAVARQAGCGADSFGLDCTPGHPADPRILRLASAMSVDLSEHRTQRAADIGLLPTDLVIPMEPSQIGRLPVLPPGTQVTLLGLWGRCQSPYIHDPFSASAVYFDKCGQLVQRATLDLLRNYSAGKP